MNNVSVSGLTVFEEDLVLPDGSRQPGLRISVEYVFLDEKGEPILIQSGRKHLWFRIEDVPSELLEALLRLIDLVKPTPEEVAKELSLRKATRQAAQLEKCLSRECTKRARLQATPPRSPEAGNLPK